MTAASILAMPKPLAALPGAMAVAAPGAENEASFADMVAADSGTPGRGAPAPAREAPKSSTQAASAAHTTQAPRPLVTTSARAQSDEEPIAETDVAPTQTMPNEDESAAQAQGDADHAIALQNPAADGPVDPSAALLSLLVTPAPASQSTLQVATGTALASAAASAAGLPEELAPAPEGDAANAEADTEAAARQAAAAQALAAALPATKLQLRPVEAPPLKDAPANASSAGASETGESSVSADTAGAPSLNAASTGLSDQVASPAAGSSGQQTALPPITAIESSAAAAGATQPVSGAPAPSTTTSPPAAPVVVTHASNLAQVTVETTVQIAAQITRKLEGRSTRFEMGMTPEGLGRVDISLDIDSGGKLTARLAFDNPLAATEMRGKADELRRELQDAGFTIANDGLEFSERQSSPDGGFDRRQGRAFAGASRINADADLAQPTPAAWVSLSLTPRGVDMKV